MNEFGKIKNPLLKKQWLADLRSGNYRQWKRRLCKPTSKSSKVAYCCLGVLCRSIQKLDAFPIEFKDGELIYNNDKFDTELPENLRKEIGITKKGHYHLISMNDSYTKNFKEIADFIEINL